MRATLIEIPAGGMKFVPTNTITIPTIQANAFASTHQPAFGRWRRSTSHCGTPRIDPRTSPIIAASAYTIRSLIGADAAAPVSAPVNRNVLGILPSVKATRAPIAVASAQTRHGIRVEADAAQATVLF